MVGVMPLAAIGLRRVTVIAAVGITVIVRLPRVAAPARVWRRFRRAWFIAIGFRVRHGPAVGAMIRAVALMARSSVRRVRAHDALAFGRKRFNAAGEAFHNLSTARLYAIAKPAIIGHASFHRVGELDRLQA